MQKLKISISVLATTLLLLIGFNAKAQVGITAVPFLQIEPDSRMAGMGNAGVAIADNAAAVFWNPAGLAFQTDTQISITHADWLPNFNTDLFYDYLVGAYHLDGIGTIGGHVTFLNLGEQEYRDENNNFLGRFTSYELAVGASYGFKLTPNWGIGLGTRFIYSSLVPRGTTVGEQEAQNGVSVGFDVAALYRTNPFYVGGRAAEVSAGFNLSNIGPAIQYNDEAQSDPLPTLLRLGWSYKMDLDVDGNNTLTFSNDFSKIMARRDADGEAMSVGEALFRSWDTYQWEPVQGAGLVDVPLAEQFMIGVGMEYWYTNLFALRAGYFYEAPNNGNREFLTFGAGLRYSFFGVDFSYIYTIEEEHPLGNTIRLSALINL